MDVRRSSEVLLGEERRLHERILGRDELALLACFDRTGGMLYCAALSMSGTPAAAEALTEALFVELWRSPESFAPDRGPLGLQMLRRLAEPSASSSAGQAA